MSEDRLTIVRLPHQERRVGLGMPGSKMYLWPDGFVRYATKSIWGDDLVGMDATVSNSPDRHNYASIILPDHIHMTAEDIASIHSVGQMWDFVKHEFPINIHLMRVTGYGFLRVLSEQMGAIEVGVFVDRVGELVDVLRCCIGAREAGRSQLIARSRFYTVPMHQCIKSEPLGISAYHVGGGELDVMLHDKFSGSQEGVSQTFYPAGPTFDNSDEFIMMNCEVEGDLGQYFAQKLAAKRWRQKQADGG